MCVCVRTRLCDNTPDFFPPPSGQYPRPGFSCVGHFSCFLSVALSSSPSGDLYRPWFIWCAIFLHFSLSNSFPSSLCFSPIPPLLLHSSAYFTLWEVHLSHYFTIFLDAFIHPQGKFYIAPTLSSPTSWSRNREKSKKKNEGNYV